MTNAKYIIDETAVDTKPASASKFLSRLGIAKKFKTIFDIYQHTDKQKQKAEIKSNSLLLKNVLWNKYKEIYQNSINIGSPITNVFSVVFNSSMSLIILMSLYFIMCGN